MLRRLCLLAATPLLLPVAAVAVAAIAWPLLLLVLLVDLLWWPVAALRRRPLPYLPRDARSASIVTVTWNGRHWLEVLLPSLRAVVQEQGGDHEVIVVDNGSTDGTVEWLQREHPWVRVVALPENRFFVRGNLAGVQAATRDVLVFLNNDMEVKPGFLQPLLDGLRDPKVFGVAAEVFFRNPHKRREETGRTRGAIARGWLKLAHVEPTRDERALDLVPTFWAGGGSAAFDRRVYLAIGGFDTLYDPFYMEDTGLSYQAWRRGFRVLFTARAAVLHEHRGTSRKVFGDDYIDNVIRRNQHLFLWRNVTDPGFTASVLGGLPLSMFARARRPRGSYLAGLWFELRAFLRALPRLPQALQKRCASRASYRLSDRQVAAAANGIAAHRAICGTELGTLPVPDARRGRKILVLSARLPRRDHDGSWVLFERLRAMAVRHRVTLFAFVDDPADAIATAPLSAAGIEVVIETRQRNRRPGNLHHRVPWRLWRDYSAPPMRAAVQRMLEGTDHDLVQVEYLEMAHLVASEPRVRPRLYVCHESAAVAAARTARGPGAAFRALQADRYERQLLASFDGAVALSAADAAALAVQAPALPVEVVPSGIDVAAFAPVSGNGAVTAADAATIAFVGYYKHAPNVDAAQWLVHEILPRVRQQVPAARVRLIGRDAPAEVSSLARDGAVEVPGFVPDLAGALAHATVVALPLRQGGGLRGKLLEAWAAGRPVVTTRVACEGFEVAAGEDCLVADDAPAFAAALVRCLQEPALRDTLARAGRAHCTARYSVAAAAAAFDGVYERLCAGRTQ
jgi:GT2 family glycosyltransferase